MNKKKETQVNDGQSDEYLVELGHRIKEARESKGMNVVNICFFTELAVGTISNVERGKNVSYLTLHKILLALKIPPDKVLPKDDHVILPIEVAVTESDTQKYLGLVDAYRKVAGPLGQLIEQLRVARQDDLEADKKSSGLPTDPREPALKDLGERVRDIRLARNLSVSDLASASEQHSTAIQLIELGFRKPSLDSLRRIAAALKVATADLFPGSPDQKDSFRALRTRGLYSSIQSVSEQVELFRDNFDALDTSTRNIVN